MAERRGRIVAAAAELIRETGGTDFSMEMLARRVGVQPATLYNLFRSKSGLLYALLYRCLDDIVRDGLIFTSTDPIRRVLEAAEVAAGLTTRDPAVLRPLCQFLIGVRDDHRDLAMRRSHEFWRAALEKAEEEGLLASAAEREALARQLTINFLGTMDVWVHEELDAVGFRAQILYGTALLLFAIVDDGRRPLLGRQLRAAQRKLAPRVFSERDRVTPVVPLSPQSKRRR